MDLSAWYGLIWTVSITAEYGLRDDDMSRLLFIAWRKGVI
jgi:hypothetical protein